MDKDKATYLQLTSLYSRIANYWKYYIGQTEQLKRLDIVDEKRMAEEKFSKWERDNNMDAGLLANFALIYKDYAPYAKHAVYFSECFRASALARMASAMKPLYDAYQRNDSKDLSTDTLNKYITAARAAYRRDVKEFDPGTEKDMFTAMTRLYSDSIDKDQLPDIYEHVIFNKKNKSGYRGKSYEDYTAFVFAHTFLADSNKFNEFCAAPSFEQLKKDAAVAYALSYVNDYMTNYQPKIEAFNNKKSRPEQAICA